MIKQNLNLNRLRTICLKKKSHLDVFDSVHPWF